MMFLHTPSLTEDAKHASVVITSAVAAIAATVSFFAALQPEPVDHVALEAPPVVEAPALDPMLGADRIYGRVTMASGDEVTGYIRWNGREASWADVLPAREARGNAVAGLQFGHMVSLTPVRGNTVRAVLKSGEEVEVTAISSGDAAELAALLVEQADGIGISVPWFGLTRIDFMPEPLASAPFAERIHGTVVTRDGMSFTGYVMWDMAEALMDEALDGGGQSVEFGEVSELRRRAEGGVTVATTSGAAHTLTGTRDVNRTNRGIVVADPGLGSVVIPFERFAELRLHPAQHAADYESFDGGRALRGVVRTGDGRQISGEVRWDRDEASTWELLDGQYNGLQFHIAMDQISWIEKTWLGATVELLDGRSFYLLASNDVNWTNKGIEVSSSSTSELISWEAFDRIDFERPSAVAPAGND